MLLDTAKSYKGCRRADLVPQKCGEKEKNVFFVIQRHHGKETTIDGIVGFLAEHPEPPQL